MHTLYIVLQSDEEADDQDDELGSDHIRESNSSDGSPVPYATCKEKYLNGLLKGKKQSRRNITIGFLKG